MELTHLLHNISCSIVAEEGLVEQAVLFVVIKLKSTSLLTTQDGSESLVYQCLRSDWEVFVVKVIVCDHVIGALEKAYVQLDVLELKFFFSLQKHRELGLHSVDADSLGLKFDNLFFGSLHAGEQFTGIAIMHIMLHFVLKCNRVELVAPLVESLRVIDDSLVQLSHFRDENLTLLAVSVFESTEFIHDFMCVRAHVLEHLRLNLALLMHLVKPRLQVFVLVFEFVFKNLDFSLCLCYFEINLLENVKFVVCIENGFF